MRTRKARHVGWLSTTLAASAIVSTAAQQSTPAQTSALLAAGNWNTVTADITVRRSRVAADGTPAGEAAPTTRYRWERRLTAAGWHSTLTLVDGARPVIDTSAGPKALDNPFAIARIEDDEDGSPLRMFNGKDEEVPTPSVPLAGLPAGADAPEAAREVSMAGAGVRPMTFGRDWVDAVVPSSSRTSSRRAALERRHGKAVGRVGGLDRFITTTGDDTLEVLADPVWALPLEINTVRSGALVSHTTLLYAAGSGGTLVRRTVRTEHGMPGGDGERLVTDVEFANVRLEQRR